MKLKFLTFITVAILSSITSLCGAQVKQYSLKVADFNQLKVVDGINVEYRTSADSAGFVAFRCEADIARHILFEPSKKKLSIKLSNDRPADMTVPTVIAYSSSLKKVENSGDSTVIVLSPRCTDKFTAKVIGNGHLIVTDVIADEVNAKIETGKGIIDIDGECAKASLSSTGKGHIRAEGLESVDAKCSIWGTGSIGCNVLNKLQVVGLGSGRVFYRGIPREINNSGAGIKLEHLGN